MLATRNVQQTSSLGAETVFHTVRFTGLEPETKYLYRVGDGTNWSEWLEFETAAATYRAVLVRLLRRRAERHPGALVALVRQAFTDAPEAKLGPRRRPGQHVAADGQWGEWFKAAVSTA